MKMNVFTKSILIIMVSVGLYGCSGTPGSGGGGSSSPSGTYTVGGTVTGMTGSGLVLQDNSGDNLPITANGAFVFHTAITKGNAYSVTVLTQPTSPVQTCTVGSGGGTSSVNVTSVLVTCGSSTATISVSVTGLAGSGLVLQD